MVISMASISDADRSPRPIHLAFHKILNRLTYGSTNFAPERLFRLLDFLKNEGRLSRIKLTFDDGYEHLVGIIPRIIQEHSLRPIIFIPTAWIGKSNSWDYSHSMAPVQHLCTGSIKKLAEAGAVIASHGHTHRSLIDLTPEQLRSELLQSKNILEDITGERVDSISYPFGRCHRIIMQIAHECGYGHGYTMNFPDKNDSKLALGRIGIWTFDTPFSIMSKINRGPIQLVERAKAAVTNRLSSGTTLLNRLRGEPT